MVEVILHFYLYSFSKNVGSRSLSHAPLRRTPKEARARTPKTLPRSSEDSIRLCSMQYKDLADRNTSAQLGHDRVNYISILRFIIMI
jgi:hypothetical protein